MKLKKKIFIPLVVFLIGTCLAGLIVYQTNLYEKENKLTITQSNATSYGERIKQEILMELGLLIRYSNCLLTEMGPLTNLIRLRTI